MKQSDLLAPPIKNFVLHRKLLSLETNKVAECSFKTRLLPQHTNAKSPTRPKTRADNLNDLRREKYAAVYRKKCRESNAMPTMMDESSPIGRTIVNCTTLYDTNQMRNREPRPISLLKVLHERERECKKGFKRLNLLRQKMASISLSEPKSETPDLARNKGKIENHIMNVKLSDDKVQSLNQSMGYRNKLNIANDCFEEWKLERSVMEVESRLEQRLEELDSEEKAIESYKEALESLMVIIPCTRSLLTKVQEALAISAKCKIEECVEQKVVNAKKAKKKVPRLDLSKLRRNFIEESCDSMSLLEDTTSANPNKSPEMQKGMQYLDE